MYDELKKIYDESGHIALFSMAVSYLIDKGSRFTSQITDEDIESLEGNGLMTKEFEQNLVRTARKLAQAIKQNPVALIQFCDVEEIFDTTWFKENEDDC